MSNPIPEELQSFVIGNIDSIAELEALLLLRENRHRSWTSTEVAERLYIGERITATLLANLANRGLVAAEGTSPSTYQYGPRNQDLARLLDKLAEVYAKYLVPVTDLVHRKTRRSVNSFADAFKFTKEE